VYRRLTVTGRLDPGYFQDLFKVLRNKVANSKTDVLEGTIHDEVLHDGPKLANLAFLGDIWRVDQEEVGSRA
jgi:hypothetical protein